MSNRKLFIASFTILVAAASAIVTSDCETVLPTICKINGAGSHCHPCVASAYVDCSDDAKPELKSCPSGHLWDALLSQCKPESWVQPRHTQCEAGKTIQLPNGFRVTSESAAAVAAAAAALEASQEKHTSWHALLSRTNAAVQTLAQKLARRTAQANSPQGLQQQQPQNADLASSAAAAAALPAQAGKASPKKLAIASGGAKPSGTAATAAAAASIDESKMQQLQTTVQEVQALREKAANLTAEANKAEQLAAQQVAAVQAALDSKKNVASAMPELQQRVLVAETARQAAQSLREKAEDLLRAAEAQAASAAAEIATLAASATLAVSQINNDNGQPGMPATADASGLLGGQPSATVGTIDQASRTLDRTLDRTIAAQQQQQQKQQQKQQPPQKLGASGQEGNSWGSAAAEGLQEPETGNGDYTTMDASASGDPYMMKLAHDFAAAASQMVQGLAKQDSGKGKADSHMSILGTAVRGNNVMSSFVGLQHSITSNSGKGSDNSNKNVLAREQAQGRADAGSSSKPRGEEEPAVDEEMAQQLERKRALEAAIGSDFDFSALFRVDEGSPQGRPVEDSNEEGGREDARRVREDREREQQWQQRQPEQQDRQRQQQKEPSAREQQPKGQQQQQQQQQQQTIARDSATIRQSVKLSVRFHEALVRAAGERVNAGSSSSSSSAALSAQLPSAQTEAHISQLAEFFYSVLSVLTEEGRAVVLGIHPGAAFSVVAASTGTPVVSLQPQLSAVLRAADALELGDILNLQVRDVGESLLQLVKVNERTAASKGAANDHPERTPSGFEPSLSQQRPASDSQQLQELGRHDAEDLMDGDSSAHEAPDRVSHSVGPSPSASPSEAPQQQPQQQHQAAKDAGPHALSSRDRVPPAGKKQQQQQAAKAPAKQQQQQQKAQKAAAPAAPFHPEPLPAAAAATDEALLEAFGDLDSAAITAEYVQVAAVAAPEAADVFDIEDYTTPAQVATPAAAAAEGISSPVKPAAAAAAVDPDARLLSNLQQPQVTTVMAVEVPMTTKPAGER